MASERRYRWEWQLASSPEQLWPLVADTNRFNREVGIPRVEQLEVAEDGEGARKLRLAAPGRPVVLEEAPFEWVRPERFGVVRTYESGPFEQIRSLLEISSRDRGSTLVYDVAVRTRGPLGRVAAPLLIGRTLHRRFDETFRRYDQAASLGVEPAPLERLTNLAPGGRERLARRARELIDGGADARLVEELVSLIERAEDISLTRLRPYSFAAAWDAPRRTVLELFLQATRCGLLESRWEVLCPLCRGAADTTEHLAGLSHDSHCESCKAEFAPSFDRQVELTFRPSAAVRDVPTADYCVGGPGTTPHVIVQQVLVPGERRTMAAVLEPGTYRLRARGLSGTQAISATPGGMTAMELELSDGHWPDEEVILDPRVAITLVNPSETTRTVIIERTAWADDAATAADVTALQAFRDLFGAEALRPGEEMAIGSLTIVFTDLRDSTRLYRRIGDAPAFGSVSSHFDVLRGEITSEGGAVVKTIGDAVMAVFRRPVSSLRAMLAAQYRLANGAAGRPLELKVGLHVGPCIAVTLNDRLDYFGSTVNAAARIASLSNGSDVVLSDAVRADPEVTAYVSDGAIELEALDAELRGFDDERFALWRMRQRGE